MKTIMQSVQILGAGSIGFSGSLRPDTTSPQRSSTSKVKFDGMAL